MGGLLPLRRGGSCTAVRWSVLTLSTANAHTQAIVESLKSRHILISTMAPGVLRLVTHLDVGDEDIDAVVDALQQLAATGEGKAAADGATAGGKAGGGAVGTQGGLNGSGGCGYGASPAAVASGAAAPGANAGTGSSE